MSAQSTRPDPIELPTAWAQAPECETVAKATALRALLASPQLDFIMEAHDGLFAKIVEEAGFQGIWASELAMFAALGVRDSNEASWTQVLEVLEFMADATSVSMLVDGDTGYGNFNNVRPVVRKLCQRGISGICIEDKLFPKTNSIIGDGQPLADTDEFCGRIKAGKDSQTDDFSLVARAEALKRAGAYHAAGADAILIHSKQHSADEILTFAEEWGNRCPIVIVPTTYYATPTDDYRAQNISLVIWANHNLRASISAMREVSRRIHRDESLAEIKPAVASVKEALHGECLIAYGDILFRQYIMDQLLSAEGDIVLVVDALWKDRDPDPRSRLRDLVSCSTPFITGYMDQGRVFAPSVGPDLAEDDIDGEWIGLAKFSDAGSEAMRNELDMLGNSGDMSTAGLCDLFNNLIAVGQDIQILYVTGHWLNVDNQSDLEAARSFL